MRNRHCFYGMVRPCIHLRVGLTKATTGLKWMGLCCGLILVSVATESSQGRGHSLKPGWMETVSVLSEQWCLSGCFQGKLFSKGMWFFLYFWRAASPSIQKLKLIKQFLENMKLSSLFFFPEYFSWDFLTRYRSCKEIQGIHFSEWNWLLFLCPSPGKPQYWLAIVSNPFMQGDCWSLPSLPFRPRWPGWPKSNRVQDAKEMPGFRILYGTKWSLLMKLFFLLWKQTSHTAVATSALGIFAFFPLARPSEKLPVWTCFVLS